MWEFIAHIYIGGCYKSPTYNKKRKRRCENEDNVDDDILGVSDSGIMLHSLAHLADTAVSHRLALCGSRHLYNSISHDVFGILGSFREDAVTSGLDNV